MLTTKNTNKILKTIKVIALIIKRVCSETLKMLSWKPISVDLTQFAGSDGTLAALAANKLQNEINHLSK